MSLPETISSRLNPYVGTRPYEKGEILYGRERETSELLDLLIAERIVMLYSPSGAGKSSILNAAILPKMEENGFKVLPVVRINHEPPSNAALPAEFNRYVFSVLMCLEEDVAAEQRFSAEELCSLRLKDYLARYRERAKQLDPDHDLAQAILLVVDQGEEVITIAPSERLQKQAFFNQLGELLRDRSMWILYAMREDYVARMDSYIKPIPTGFATRYRLRLLQADAALSAIQKPSESQGVVFTDEAAQKLSNDLRMMQVQQADGTNVTEAGLYVEPVQLQVVCRRLWTSLERTDNEIGIDDLEKIGDVNAALADYYSLQVMTVAAKVGVQERFIRAWFDRKLITPQGIRGQVLLAPTRSDGLENTAIDELEKTYLIRSEKRGGSTWFELAHDRLLAPIIKNNADWFEKHLSVLQRQADVWNQEARPHGMLVTGPDFLKMQAWADANRADMSQTEVDFFNESKNAHQAELRERRNNLIIRWMFVAAAIGFMVTIVLFFRARIAEQRAVARELAAASLSNLTIDPELSIMLALSSQEATGDMSMENIQALHRALPAVRVEHTLNGHTKYVYAVSFSPDSKTLASGSQDGSVKIWDSVSGQELNSLQVVDPSDNGQGVTNVAYSPDGKTLAVSTQAGTVLFYGSTSWQVMRSFSAHDSIIWGVAYSPDGSLLATGAEDTTVKLWDAHSGAALATFGAENCSDSAACGQGHTAKINTLTFSPDGKLLASAGDDNVIRVWDVAAKKSAFTFNGANSHTGDGVLMLAFSPDGKQLASSGADRLIKIWDVESHNWVMNITGNSDWVYAVAYTSDGQKLITAGADRIIRIWDTTYGRLQASLPGHTGQIFDIGISADGQRLASASDDATVRIWNIAPDGSREIHTLVDVNRVNTVASSPDGSLLASGGYSQKVKIWDAHQGTLLNTLTGHTGVVEGLSWGPDGKWLVSGSRDGTAIVWDVASGTQRLVFDQHKKEIWDVVVSADGSLAASGYGSGIVYIWDPVTGRVIQTLQGEYGSALSVDISPDQKWLAAGYEQKTIVIWDLATGKPAFPLSGHTDYVESVRFSHDGSLLASVSDDGTLLLWDMTATPPALLSRTSAHRGTIYAVAFSHDDTYVITGGADGLIHERDISLPEAPRLAQTFYGFTDRVQSLDTDSEDWHIVSSGTDGTIRVFTLDAAELVEQARSRLTRSMNEAECQEFFDSTCAEFQQTNWLDELTIYLADLFNIDR